MLPSIKCNPSDFKINVEGIDDLLTGIRDREGEIVKLQSALDDNQTRLNTLFSRSGKGQMDRENFEKLVEYSLGRKAIKTANEIFSCATNLYSSDDSPEDEYGDDKYMTNSEFAVGVVRLSNLCSMIYNGIADSSSVSEQTRRFLSSGNKK